MSESLSGRDIGARNLQRFRDWIVEREAAGDWSDYIRNDKLNRSEIATECGFALSALRQNPAIKEALKTLEASLTMRGILGVGGAASAPDDATSLAADRRIMVAKGKAEQRVKSLEEQNAALRAEVHELRERLSHFKHLDEHLCRTGRLLPP